MTHKQSKLIKSAVALAAAFLVAFAGTTTYAAKGDQGTDNSVYQGANGKFYNSDKFTIDQVGGYYNGSFVPHWTYASQVRNQLNYGKHVHTYIYAQFSGRWQADQMLNYYLPRIQTPKGSIVALDVESGWPDYDSVVYALNRIKAAGYTPVLYGYKNFLINHLGYNGLYSISTQFPLWLAEYPDYSVRTTPNYNFFPSFNNVAIFQFTSTYAPGGLDGNIDLTGITDNGYKNGNPQKPKTNTPAVTTGKQLHRDSHNYTVMPGDSWWKIATEHHMNMYALAQLNGATIQTVIHPGQVLRVADSGQGNKVSNKVTQPIAQPSQSSWRDGLGDTWHAEKGTFVAGTWLHLRWGAKPNSSSIAVIGPGSVIKYDAYSRHNGFVYVRQPRGNGQYGYVAVRSAYTNEPYGKFE